MEEKKSPPSKQTEYRIAWIGGITIIFMSILLGVVYPILGILGEIWGLWLTTQKRTHKEKSQGYLVTPLYKRPLVLVGATLLVFWNVVSISAYNDMQKKQAQTAQQAQTDPAPKPEAQPEPAPKPEAQPDPAPKPEAQPDPAPKPEAQPEPAPEAEKQPAAPVEAETDTDETNGYKLLHGTLLSANPEGGVNMDTLVIKAKIQPSYSNRATINQNYFNIEDIIKKQGGSKFPGIDYWAVADMTDGTESKVISFFVPGDVISALANQQIAANQLGDYVEDLYILPSLLE